jgi:hypothetical protein
MKNLSKSQKTQRFALVLIAILSLTLFVLPARAESFPKAAAATEVEINGWYLHNWSLVTSPYSCRDSAKGCWANPNYHVISWLLSAKSVTVDSSWNNPALIYWTKYYSTRLVTFCYVEVQQAGSPRWDRVKAIGGTNMVWRQVAVDLKAYSGKSILVKFYCEPTMQDFGETYSSRIYNKQILYVQGVTVMDNPNP